MERDNFSELENLSDILKNFNFNYNCDYQKQVEKLLSCWKDVVGEKLSKYSFPKTITDDGEMIICCKNSVVASELFNSRIEINKKLKKISKENEISFFKYIKITYS